MICWQNQNQANLDTRTVTWWDQSGFTHTWGTLSTYFNNVLP